MALLDRVPRHLFTQRGWGMIAAGGAALGAAHVMGRRDLLTLSVLLIVLPLVSLAGIRLVKPRFQVYREFNPSPVETSAPTTVRLAVARTGNGSGRATMEERLPSRFGESPAFRFPSRSATGGTSRYEYRLRSVQRGQFLIGPVTAEFTDPFGLSLHRQAIDDGDVLTVTPAAVVLPLTGLAGARGNDGVTATRIRANPSDDDVMTREYRHGDPMRRVHWAATARHGDLMVRQEESVTTPEATIIMDHRLAAFSGGGAGHEVPAGPDGHPMASSEAFEWSVVAVMSISAHLAERNYALRLLDTGGGPAFLKSPSAPEPEMEEYSGSGGLQSIGESLAAIQLTGAQHAHRDTALRGLAAKVAGPTERHPHHPAAEAFDDLLMDKLSAHRMRGPLIAVLGTISRTEALALAPAAGYGTNAFALIVVDRPQDSAEVLEVLRQGGWRAVAVPPSVPVPAAWNQFDQDVAVPPPTAEVRRGAGVAR
ncbi:uncharacterized conserved protein [Pseudarthrobacter phenanthrenivorans Sphe3]|uniref:Uncharacterized conserved protein n=1 Tax=Pseudarthrobacter phenanthrenivorans (strain DSM 18606 / JCM 16027 / LMG 23796 / Sphe3) TaxID=930171 RepID=F0M5N5_PSEPM|nr:DUF58 domain-containing protein [Pseudarthrobacter phenanthrenivorans]ADX72415.1 uncharacterized conserved protein [Pseudarthrobacter phenanthrenivorans Sphe3]